MAEKNQDKTFPHFEITQAVRAEQIIQVAASLGIRASVIATAGKRIKWNGGVYQLPEGDVELLIRPPDEDSLDIIHQAADGLEHHDLAA
jgi:hypothetical protein